MSFYNLNISRYKIGFRNNEEKIIEKNQSHPVSVFYLRNRNKIPLFLSDLSLNCPCSANGICNAVSPHWLLSVFLRCSLTFTLVEAVRIILQHFGGHPRSTAVLSIPSFKTVCLIKSQGCKWQSGFAATIHSLRFNLLLIPFEQKVRVLINAPSFMLTL